MVTESFANRITKSDEDSAVAICLLLIASYNGAAMKETFGGFMEWFGERVKLTVDEAQGRIRRCRHNCYALEFFSGALLEKIGIKSAPALICSEDEARHFGADYVVKAADRLAVVEYLSNSIAPETADIIDAVQASVLCVDVRVLKFLRAEARVRRLTSVGHTVLVVQVVPDAASIDFVSRKLLPQSCAATQVQRSMRDSGLKFARSNAHTDELIAKTIGKSCLPADELFSGFRPSPEELRMIESAIWVTGEKYLRVLATRVFLGISAGHFGNVLVTRKGELVSIDHVSGRIEKGDDLEMLFKFVNRDSLVFHILEEIGKLSEEDIRASAAAIPDHPACGSTDGLAEYFMKRLKLFRELCSTPKRDEVPLPLAVRA